MVFMLSSCCLFLSHAFLILSISFWSVGSEDTFNDRMIALSLLLNAWFKSSIALSSVNLYVDPVAVEGKDADAEDVVAEVPAFKETGRGLNVGLTTSCRVFLRGAITDKA